MRSAALTAFLVAVAATFALQLAACGGGGEQEGGQTASTPAPPANEEATVDIVGENLLFDVDRIDVPAGRTVEVVFDNRDVGVQHNFAVYETSEAKALLAGTAVEAGPVVQELTFDAPPAGEYFFRCDVHPTTMAGTLVVK